jgi:hypothetical protein
MTVIPSADMPSKLNGLFFKVEWKHYAVRQEAAPKPQQIAVAANTDTRETMTAAPELIPGTKQYRLADSVQMTIALVPSNTFQKSWVATTMTDAQRDELLSHEQGHYDIHALLSRDYFLALMELKSKTYANPNALTNDINALQRATTGKSAAVQAKYDTDTGTGSKPVEQAKWKAMIEKAFTTAATPPQMAGDGVTPIKVKLLDVLKQNGFTF